MKLSDIFEGDVVQGNFKQHNVRTPVSLEDAFSNDGYQAAKTVGIKFIEKPDYFSMLRDSEHAVNDLQLKRLEKALGHKLDELSVAEIWGNGGNADDDLSTHAPTRRIKKSTADLPETMIIKFPSGNRYLVNTTGANTYLRMWQRIGTNRNADDDARASSELRD